jgi:osmotically-inducible protein OsmY
MSHRSGNRSARSLLLAAMVACLGACSAFAPNDTAARTVGTVIDDESLEITAARAIRQSDPALAEAHVNVNSYGGVVLLTGQVPSDAARAGAERALENLRKVERIHNELDIAGPSSLVARQADTWLTTKVKAQLVADESVNADHFKVVTENSVVYLMGRVTRAESTRAVEVARNVYGVQRVVTVFDFLD